MQSSCRSTQLPDRGFSLVELLVAVTLIGIAIGFGLPKINRMTNQAKVHRAARALQMEIQQAFAIAGRNRQPVRIRWNGANMELRIMNYGENLVFRRATLGAGSGYGLTSTEVVVSRSSLVVFPSGLAEDTLSITLSKSGFSRRVRVSRSGLVRQQ